MFFYLNIKTEINILFYRLWKSQILFFVRFWIKEEGNIIKLYFMTEQIERRVLWVSHSFFFTTNTAFRGNEK